MTVDEAERRRRAAAIFERVADLDATDQTRALDAECGDDVELRHEVDRLLRADADGGRLLSQSLAGLAFVPPVAEREPADRVGERIGPYVVLRLIGRGGMGDVFLAARADGQFDQEVALKVVRREYAAPAIVRRFLAERQILARLRHTNVAQLLDGGVSSSGEPFFAMEYVDGRPITDATIIGTRPLDARLRLWLDACAAVQYAHRNLVVHRDIKPSNVLVTGEGQVKLVDFGIATVLGGDEGRPGPTTLFGARALTPAYAAPEQLRGEPVTTATDVYGLGAVLYELLCGHRAVDVDRPRFGDVEFVPPSRRVATADARRLRGDLDTIALTALARRPEDRYPSVDALADDVRRHLDARPIAARSLNVAYKARRFARRHRVAVAAGAVAILALVVGSGVAVWQARKALAEARRVTEVKDFLIGLFESADPEVARRTDVSARELLDHAVARLDTTLTGEAALRIELLTLSGTIYRKLGAFDSSISALERAARTASEGGADPRARLAALTALGSTLKEAGQYARAERVLRESLAGWEIVAGRDAPATTPTLADLAAVLARRGAKEEAERLHRRLLEIDERAYGRRHAEVVQDLDNFGVFLLGIGKYDDADRALTEALTTAKTIVGPDDVLVATVLGNLAVLRSMQDRVEESLAFQRNVLAIRRRIYGDSHPDVALSMSNIAATLINAGQLEEGQAMHRQALEIRRKVLGPTHQDTITNLNGLAVAAYLRGDLVTAIASTREAVAAWRQAVGEDGPAYLTGINNLGVMLGDAGELPEAERWLRDAMTGRERALGADNVEAAHARRNLAVVLHRRGRDAEAERLVRAALATEARQIPDTHPRRVDATATLGAILLAQGRAAESEPLLRAAEAARRARLGGSHADTLEARGLLGACLTALGRQNGLEMLAASHQALSAKPGQQARVAELLRYMPISSRR